MPWIFNPDQEGGGEGFSANLPFTDKFMPGTTNSNPIKLITRGIFQLESAMLISYLPDLHDPDPARPQILLHDFFGQI